MAPPAKLQPGNPRQPKMIEAVVNSARNFALFFYSLDRLKFVEQIAGDSLVREQASHVLAKILRQFAVRSRISRAVVFRPDRDDRRDVALRLPLNRTDEFGTFRSRPLA